MRIKTLTVSEVNNYIKKILDNDFILNNLSVRGEISNLKYHSSGHIYFSLKDKTKGASILPPLVFGKYDFEKFKIESKSNIIASSSLSQFLRFAEWKYG